MCFYNKLRNERKASVFFDFGMPCNKKISSNAARLPATRLGRKFYCSFAVRFGYENRDNETHGGSMTYSPFPPTRSYDWRTTTPPQTFYPRTRRLRYGL